MLRICSEWGIQRNVTPPANRRQSGGNRTESYFLFKESLDAEGRLFWSKIGNYTSVDKGSASMFHFLKAIYEDGTKAVAASEKE